MRAMARWLALLCCVIAVLVVALSPSVQSSPSANAQLAHHYVLPMLARDGPNGAVTHAVQPGDTLRAIAHRYHTSADVIANFNGLPLSYEPQPGEYLFAPAPPAPQTSRLVTNGPRGSGKIALTFDMGGRVDPALDIMNFLIANDVRATIFMTGAIINSPFTDAGRQVLGIINANLDLFELGNHSYSHPDFPALTAGQMQSELATTQAAINQYSTLQTAPLFRPPSGAWDSRVLSVVGQAGYTETIMWDVDTIDWRPESDGGPTTAQIVTKVLNNAQGGSIVLMHLGGYNTFAALPDIVNGLRDRGFELVTVGELLAP